MRVVEHRHRLGTRWRRLAAGRQALLTLARLAAGFVVGTTTVYRYAVEAVAFLASLAPTLADAREAAAAAAAAGESSVSPELPSA